VLAGVLVGGFWAAIEAAHSDGDSFPIATGAAFVIVGTVGGFAGGALGALTYTATHDRTPAEQ
jgi:hypothetical protein